jgi:hypothetical protein
MNWEKISRAVLGWNAGYKKAGGIKTLALGNRSQKDVTHHSMPSTKHPHVPEVVHDFELADIIAVDGEICECRLVQQLVTIPGHVDHGIVDPDPVCSVTR